MKSYTYEYEGLSRLTGVAYSGPNEENYGLSWQSYDANGGLLNLVRSGEKSDGTFVAIDQLAYTYSSNGAITSVRSPISQDKQQVLPMVPIRGMITVTGRMVG